MAVGKGKMSEIIIKPRETILQVNERGLGTITSNKQMTFDNKPCPKDIEKRFERLKKAIPISMKCRILVDEEIEALVEAIDKELKPSNKQMTFDDFIDELRKRFETYNRCNCPKCFKDELDKLAKKFKESNK